MGFSRTIRCRNCGRRTKKAHSCQWCKYPIQKGRYLPRLPEVVVQQTQHGFFYGFVVVAFACLILVITQGTYYSFGVFFKPLSYEFGWTRAMTAGAFSMCTVLWGFFFIFTGRLNDTIGPRFVLTVCGISLGVGYILMSNIDALWQFYLFYGLIVAIGMSGGYIPLLSTVSRWFVKRRALMAGFVAAGTGIGTLIIPPVANWLIGEYDWRKSFLIVGIGSLVIIVLAAQFLKRDPGQIGQVPDGRQTEMAEFVQPRTVGLTLKQAIRTFTFWIYALSLFCFVTCLMVIMVHLVPHATDIGISPTQATSILAVVGATGIVGRIALGALADRIGNKQTYVLSLAFMCVNLTILLFAKEIWLFYLFAVVLGLAYGGQATLIAPFVADLFGLRSHGVILGASTFIGTIGGAIGPVLVGRIFDVTGSYQLGFIILIGVSFLGFIIATFLRPAITEAR